MKKMMLGLAAVFAMSVAVPAYATEEAPADKGAEKAKPAKKGKKDKKEADKPADAK